MFMLREELESGTKDQEPIQEEKIYATRSKTFRLSPLSIRHPSLTFYLTSSI